MPLANISNPLGGGAGPTTGIIAGGVLYGLNGQTITGNATGAWTVAGNSTGDITLTAGSSGASLALGQGANGSVSIAGAKLGIGTASPNTFVEINTATSATSATTGAKLRIAGNGDSSNSAAEIQLYDRSADTNWNIGIRDSTDSGSFRISNGTFGANTRDDLVISSGGNIGIGTDSPGQKVHVLAELGAQDNADGFLVEGRSTVTTNNTAEIFAISGQATRQRISAGVTESGGRVGVTGDAYSNSTDFAGTIAYQRGIRGRAGFAFATSGAVATEATGGFFEILNEASGATIANAYGVRISNIETTGSITNRYGLHAVSTGASTQNIAGYFSAASGTTNYGIYVANGQSYFGDSVSIAPTGTGQFVVTAPSGGNTRVAVLKADATGATSLLQFRDSAAAKWSVGYNKPASEGLWIVYDDVNSAYRMAVTDTGNVLIGGTTDITGSGGLKVFGTTDYSGANTGSFQSLGGGYFAKSLGVAGNLTVSGVGIESTDALSGAGAISVTAATTKLTTTAADALTLADGTNGQIKRIVMVADGGDGTLTPTTKTGFTTITFNDVGDSVTLQFHTTIGWVILNNYGCTIA